MAAIDWKIAQDQLAKLVAAPGFGLFSDLDGTLSPIVQRPEDARISARNRELLAELTKLLPLVALISGRRAASLYKRVELPGITYIGNHGMERWVEGEVEVMAEAKPYLPDLQKARAELETLTIPGAYVEDKEATLSFHYRQTVNPDAFVETRENKIAQIVGDHGLVLFTGKRVFEVRPPVVMDKGIAFRDLVLENKLEAALFLGDDISDLNAFRAAKELREDGKSEAWGVGVQSEDAPEALAETADFLARGVEDVEALLAWLVEARKASST